MLAFPQVQVGDPLRHEGLTVFPLFAPAGATPDYLLSDEALAAGAVTVAEVNEAGSVPHLVVDNQAEVLVLFLEGEELRGARQNRVLNTSVLVPAKAKLTIPVSCVEQGRWRYFSRYFGSSGHHGSPKLRHVLKRSVTRSAQEGRGHRSDQGGVWQEVGRQMKALGAASPTAAMADTYQQYELRLDEFQQRLKYVEGASGLAVAVGGRVVSVDLFDRPATCRKVWDRLLTGVVMDALEADSGAEQPGVDRVHEVLGHLHAAPWRQTDPVGAGEEYRTDTGDDEHASALVLNGAVVHGSLVVGPGGSVSPGS
jgi:hypothetical protein